MRATAAALTAHQSPTVEVTIPGSDLTILCRIPDPLGQLAFGRIDLPLLRAVMANLEAWKDGNVDPAQQRADLLRAGDVLDDWICFVAIEPCIVRVPEGSPLPENCVNVADLRFTAKMAIVTQTSIQMGEEARNLTARERDFRVDGSVHAADRPDGETLQQAAVEPVGD